MNRDIARANGVPDDLLDALRAANVEPSWRFHPAAPTVAAAMAHDGTPRRPELWDGHTAERIIDAIGTRVADEAWLPYASR